MSNQWLKVKGTMHYPVLHREICQLVNEFTSLVEDQKPQLQMFDGTFGGGGHSKLLLEQHRNLKILGSDLDYHQLKECEIEYSEFIRQKRLALVNCNFCSIPAIDTKQAFKRKVTAKPIYDLGLLDLGFSSYQLQDPERGFAYMPSDKDKNNDNDGGDSENLLDMRFDNGPDSHFSSASDILNNTSQYELTAIFKQFSDERYSSVLSKHIIEQRQGRIISTTDEFRDVIKSAFPGVGHAERNKIVRRAFQAVRIAVNQELLNLQQFLDSCPELFLDTKISRKKLGKDKKLDSDEQVDHSSMLMVITFHSIEEKFVSQAFAKWKKMKLGDYATKRPYGPSQEEIEENSPSHSAKLFSFLFD